MANPKATKKKVKKNVATGIAHIQSTFNNTIVTITDIKATSWLGRARARAASRARARARRSPRRSLPKNAARKAQEHGMRSLAIFVKGPGAGRESALRAFQIVGMKITLIRDVTPIPHNGCRPPKRRRV